MGRHVKSEAAVGDGRKADPGPLAPDPIGRPERAASPDRPPPPIDCYEATFPASDPSSASSYRRLIASVFGFEIPAFAESLPFFARTEICILPQVTVSRTRSSASRFTRTIRDIARTGTDQVLLVCYRQGGFTLETAGRRREVVPGALAFIDLAQEVVIEAAAIDNLSLAISRRALEGMVPFLDDAHGLVREPGPLPKVLTGMIEDLLTLGPAVTVVDARAMAGAILQLVAACLDTPARHLEGSSGRGTVSLAAIKSVIEQRLADPELRPQSLLDVFGITRSTLYRLFEPLGGVSGYITERRLHRAFRLLADARPPRPRISQLAFDLGFRHPSAFTRAFGELFGLSPKEVRALAGLSKEEDVQLAATAELLSYLTPMTRPAPPDPLPMST
jgi:AraC-like DNA-binding protein